MPVARIITTSPAESEELRRQLTAAGFSVKFAAPNEEFTDADIVVAAANVHSDYALQYASEVAAEADADVIVAPGVVAGSADQWERALSPPTPVPPISVVEEPIRQEPSTPAAAVLFGNAQDVKPAESNFRDGVGQAVTDYSSRIVDAWQSFRQKRELAAERKRLAREQREIEREDQRRVLHQQRMEAEARMASERERLRLQRQAEQERLRREQEEMRRAIEEERARAAERESLAIEQERARVAEEQKHQALEQVLARASAHQRMAQQLSAQPAPIAPVNAPPMPVSTAAPTRRVPSYARRPPAPRRGVAPRPPGRDRRFQRAAFLASVAALLVMLGFALALNIHPTSPMSHSMVQNPVQEKSPFGAASITPVTTTPGPAAKPVAQPVSHMAVPQADKPPAAKPKPSPTRTRRASRDNYVADDEVVVHHYGQTAPPKHPPSTQTRAGIPKYTDR